MSEATIIVTARTGESYLVLRPNYRGADRLPLSVNLAASIIRQHNSKLVTNSSSNQSQQVKDAVERLKQQLNNAIIQTVLAYGSIDLPDASKLGTGDIVDILSRLEFNLVDTNFGTGRAGANTIGADGLIRVDINVNAFLTYDAWPHREGLNYLITHELSHATAGGQAVNQAMWTQFINRPEIKNLSDSEKNAQFPNSPEFIYNEKWSNSAGKTLADKLGLPTIPTPTNGYL